MKALLSIFLLLGLSHQALAETTESTPTEITITEGPQTEAQYLSYTFPNTPVNYSRYHTFWLRNRGNTPVFVNNISLYGQGFSGNSGCDGWLYPYQSCTTTVEFHPWYQGSFNGRLSFYTTGGNVFINLYGWGVYW